MKTILFPFFLAGKRGPPLFGAAEHRLQENGSIIHQDIAVGLGLLILWECSSCTLPRRKTPLQRRVGASKQNGGACFFFAHVTSSLVRLATHVLPNFCDTHL